jgi:hypothetical protein
VRVPVNVVAVAVVMTVVVVLLLGGLFHDRGLGGGRLQPRGRAEL